jgi:cobalt-zinc-cadmium efflux system outer membrane protein
MYKLVLPFAIAAALPCHTQAQITPAANEAAPGQARIVPRAVAAAPLLLAEALARVLRANPALRAGALEIDAQAGAVMQAGLAPNPELATLVEDARTASRSTTVQLNVPIELGGKRAARVKAAELGQDAASAELALKRGAVLASARAAFHDLLAAQQGLQIASESLALADGALAAASKRVLAGKNSPVDETRARIAAASVKLDLAQAGRELAGARNRLASLWGGSGHEIGHAEGELDQLPAPAALPRLMEQLDAAPALRLAQIELVRRQALAQVERSSRVPDLTVTLGTKREPQAGRNQALFGLAIPLPLFERNQGKLHEALRRSDKARVELDGARARLGNELAQAHQALVVAREQARLLQDEILPDAHSAYEAARTGFAYGKFNLIDVIDAQRSLLQARTQHLRALADAHRAGADIDSILGAQGATQTVE